MKIHFVSILIASLPFWAMVCYPTANNYNINKNEVTVNQEKSDEAVQAILNTYAEVNVYAEPNADKKNVIKTFQRNNDAWYTVFILKQQNGFYYVEVCDEQCEKNIAEGWVEKQFCGVFGRYTMNGNKAEIKIYSEPQKNSSSYTVTNLYDQFLILLDYKGEWRKVLFYFDNVFHEGWINMYCSDSYNSCT